MNDKHKQWNETITDDAPFDEAKVRTLYDGMSADYNNAVAQWGYSAPKVVADYLAQTVNTDQPVFDAGCGTGLTGQALADKGYSNITGSDLSPESVQLATESGHYQSVHELNLANPLPFDSGTFAGVISVGVFSYIENLEPVINELLRVLSNDGTLIFTQREDHYQRFNNAALFDQLHRAGGFERLVETSPQPYLPNNPSFADTIGVHYFVWRKIGE